MTVGSIDGRRLGRGLAAVLGAALLVIVGLAVRPPKPGFRPLGSSIPAATEDDEAGPYIEAALEGEAPEDFYLFRHLADGPPSHHAFQRAARRARSIGRLTEKRAPGLAAKKWSFQGPTNIGGRVVDIAVDVDRPDTIYVASASGGVWMSRDAGDSYKPIWPKNRVQSMGALVMGQDGTLWAATGETNPGGGSLTYGGDGIYMSTDRGKTWTNVGLRESHRISRIAVDPSDPNHVLVAVSGDLFKAGGDRGLYETRDGGQSWALRLAGDTETTGATDVAFDQKNPDNILVAMWDHIRYPDVRYYSGEGSGVYRSEDGGETYSRLGPANGLPPANREVGRIGVTFDPQDPNRAYAIYANDSQGAFFGWFISTDGGATWVSPPGSPSLANSQSVYGWWFARVWVDPADSN
ncbi:MAG: hypothetical protein QOK47_276, partial [Actinomycetota bacterium]|nr:hypothetical protein [Actinomycetota bacterium]